jgi:eukaryotic-like serine/threonine-protein kinase
MSQDDAELRELASALADGAEIDWASVASSAADESLRLTIHELEVIANIARVHCSSPLADPQTADSPADPFPEALCTWGTLRLLEQVGKGAFGDVYRAWDTRLDREVALKLLPAGLADSDARATSIIHEGRLLARVRHPNVVTIYGAERIENRVGLWMEFVKGRTLGQKLGAGTVFDTTQIIEIGIELCHAISAVHGAALLHRDIKAHNVMLGDDGRIVLMDFGSGREFIDKSSRRLAGTPLYLAPELLSGQEPTVRSDIYSLGVLLYHLLTGSYPVRAQNLRDLCLAHERGERTDVRTARPRVATKLARIIERAIEPAPERRYQSVDAMLPDLVALKPQSGGVRRLYASGVAAAILLLIAIVWEAGGRQGRWSSTPTALLTSVIRLNPVSVANVNPIDQPIVAVLPFENLSAEPDNDYLVDGLTDEIIGNLAVIQGLQVRSRASSFAFKDKPRNLREVGEQLGANLVVEGSVMRSGNRLRIDARLVQVAGDVPLWAERFDREIHDVFAVQDEISRAIVNKLRLRLGTGQRRYDSNIDTYILYLKARALVARRGGEAAKAAAELFQEVIRKDPAFAPAYAGLADAYAFMSHPTLSPGVAEAALPLVQQAANKALELDELLAEGHAAMGFFYARQYDWENAQKSFRRAIELDPSLTQTYTNFWSTTLLPLERLDEAEQLLQVAVRTDPLSSAVHDHLGFMKLVAGRADEAVDHFTRASALDPNLAFLDQHLGRALTFAGRLPEALSWWDTRMDSSGKFRLKDVPGGQTWMAEAYVMAGRRAEVEQWAEAHGEPYRLAVIHAALGNKDRTFEELYRAAEIVPHRIVPLLSYPEMRLLRGDPRLAALRKKLRLP